MTYRAYQNIKAAATQTTINNGSGSILVKATPVRINSAGNLNSIDVSVEAHALAFVGHTVSDINNSTNGSITSIGRIQNITIAGDFGSPVYISKSGGLTITKPSIDVEGFVSGDFILRVGVVVKNEFNSSNKDILMDICLVGQL